MRGLRLSSDAGIAIGPILFILALLGVLATVLSVGTGNFGSAAITDRVVTDLYTQAQLIRAKITECNTIYGTNNNGDGWPASSDMTNGVLVSDLECAGDPSGMKNLWSGQRNALLPQPTKGFGPWYYLNAGTSGGRCIWTESSSASGGILNGILKVVTKFAPDEAKYMYTENGMLFIVNITRPTGDAVDPCFVAPIF